MQLKEFDWLSGHGIWSIIPCPTNMVSVRVNFWGHFYFHFSLVFHDYEGFLIKKITPFALVGYKMLLYLPTQMRFLIGGERITCHWSKLSNAQWRTKLSNTLGQQYLELSTCTLSGRATWNRGKFVCHSAIEVGQRFSLEKTLILQQENWYIIRQRYIRITKGKFEQSMSSNF